jgi:hypothetical protein
MKNCWYRLNIDVTNAFRDDWKFPVPEVTDNDDSVWQFWAIKVFKQEWLDKQAALGLNFVSMMLFYRGPYMSSKSAHVDIAETDPVVKLSTYGLNWIIGGEGSEMQWYDFPDTPLNILYTPANTPYTFWPINTLNKIDSCNINSQPTLVRVGTPHSITLGSEPRWCISVRPRLNANMEWDEVVSHMRELGLLVDR